MPTDADFSLGPGENVAYGTVVISMTPMPESGGSEPVAMYLENIDVSDRIL
jgi:hypothetical protein